MSRRERVVIAHRIPAAVTPLGSWLTEIADDVVLVTSAEAADGYRGAMGEVIAVADYGSNETVEVLRRLCRDGGVSRIVSGTEDDVLRVAAVREEFGLPGMHTVAATAFIDKLVMKAAAGRAVEVPRHTGDIDPDHLRDFASRVPGPWVVKPRRSYGSRGIEVVTGIGHLLAETAGRDPDDTLVEQFVDGTLHHVDGFMCGGEVVLALPSEYLGTCLSFQDSTPLGSVQLDAADPVCRQLVDFAHAVVGALPATDAGPFHLEVFRRPDGSLVFCEIACRLGGGHIMESLTYRLGVNPVQVWYRLQAGLPADIPTVPAAGSVGFLLVPPRIGTLTAIDTPDLPGYVRDFCIRTEVPRDFRGATASTDELLGFVVDGPTAATVRENLRSCTALADRITTWV
ncbi:hypothetical protein GIS00_17185 [Nakamurella sp. YIM 132087]|uniref:ATP-grasp domain-containing protein n=1 Tax=Nakamurella alba TaxID=2665158 RepID=A0A7K1FNL3_9ACTN|nr:hypothetical protein [Nakamurella alba]MTD15670.1 hypothetical protein [Nakamurella alba]